MCMPKVKESAALPAQEVKEEARKEPESHQHNLYLMDVDAEAEYWKCSGCPHVEKRPRKPAQFQETPKGWRQKKPKERWYEVKYLCKNCGFKPKAKFIFGNPSERSILCPNCGVNDSKRNI